MKIGDNIAAYPAITRGFVGPAVGAASAISYRLLVNFPEGPQEVSGIAPAIERYPDTLKVRAIAPGTFVWVGMVQGQLQMASRELPDFQPCTPGLLRDGGAGLVAQMQAMSDEQKLAVRKALGL